MPTGYTAGILDGKISTFKQFATKCIRAFGAAVHMRDEDFDKEYVPREPSDYHSEELKKANKLLSDSQALSDTKIIKKRKDELLKSREYQLKKIEEIKANFEKLDGILKETKKWKAPTSEHVAYKEFMIEQLTSTMSHDCTTEYHVKELQRIDKELKNIDPKAIREAMVEEAREELAYHQAEFDKEVERCNESNQWVKQVVDSL